MLENWLPILKLDNYSASDLGRIKNNKTGRIIKPRLDGCGYKRVDLASNKKRITYFIHRLVLSTFSPIDDPEYTVHHINNTTTDNRIENLEWLSRCENNKRKTNKEKTESFRLFLKLKHFYSEGLLIDKLNRLLP